MLSKIVENCFTLSILESVNRPVNAALENPPLSVVPENVIRLKTKNAAAFLDSSNLSMLFSKYLCSSFPMLNSFFQSNICLISSFGLFLQ